MFTNFVEVSIYKHSTNISNDMTKKLIFAAALLFAGTAAAFAQPKVIAHRGYWTAPNSAQNSLASFSKADSVGAFGSEMDVWLTADDKLIVNHDRIYKGTEIDMEKGTLKEITSIVLPNGENIPTLDAYLRRDAEAARTVCGMDDEVDALFSSSILDLCGQLEHHPSSVPSTVDFMFIAKYIERIGDHATNIAEWAIFVETGIHPNLNDAVAPAMPAGEEKVLDKGPDEDI